MRCVIDVIKDDVLHGTLLFLTSRCLSFIIDDHSFTVCAESLGYLDYVYWRLLKNFLG